MRFAALTALLCLTACKSQENPLTQPVEQKGAACGDPEPFVRGLFAQYTDGAKPRAYETIFDDDTMGLIKRDREAAGGEVGWLDHDPVCNCQDWEKLAVTDVRVTTEPNTVAGVAFTNGGTIFRQQFVLACAPGGWRVHDIVTMPDGASLREGLAKAR